MFAYAAGMSACADGGIHCMLFSSSMNTMRERLSLFFGVNLSCSSCGEIAGTLENRLCTSLSFDMPVDLVILALNSTLEELEAGIRSKAAQWKSTSQRINSVHIISEKGEFIVHGNSQHPRRSGMLAVQSSVPVEALLHTVKALQEYYIVIPEDCIDNFSACMLDFFTPNGLPLLLQASPPLDRQPTDASFSDALCAFMHKAGASYEAMITPYRGIYGNRKKLGEEWCFFFHAFLQNTRLSRDAYLLAYQQWAYTAQKGVLYSQAPGGRNESSYF